MGALDNRQEPRAAAPPPPAYCRNREGCDWLMFMGLVLRGRLSDSPCPGWDAGPGFPHWKTGL